MERWTGGEVVGAQRLEGRGETMGREDASKDEEQEAKGAEGGS